MHEVGLSDAILDAVLHRAAGRRVRGARVHLGGHPVDADVVTHGFLVAAMGTPAEDAQLDLVMAPQIARCRACGAEEEVRDHMSAIACVHCGGLDLELDGLEEDVVLESITVEHMPSSP
jgi:hydrogenase nickel incorporation protein HypA/HybF